MEKQMQKQLFGSSSVQIFMTLAFGIAKAHNLQEFFSTEYSLIMRTDGNAVDEHRARMSAFTSGISSPLRWSDHK